MSTQDYLTWISRGSPFRLMTPAADLRDLLRRAGYVVYDIGNEAHLEAEPPEDHTPYSETGWPRAAQYGTGYAIDIMPPDDPDLPSLQQLGAQLLADRNEGVPGIGWLKYMNWEPEGDDRGPCWHESWQPGYARRRSDDRGHIHLSGLTGYETSVIGRGYDPLARIRNGGTDMLTPQQAQQLRDAHYTTAVAIPNPIGDGRVPLHVWAAWMTAVVKALAAAVSNVDEATRAQVQRDLAEATAQVRADLAGIADEVSTHLAAQVTAWAPLLVDAVREQLGDQLVDEQALTDALADALLQIALRATAPAPGQG